MVSDVHPRPWSPATNAHAVGSITEAAAAMPPPQPREFGKMLRTNNVLTALMKVRDEVTRAQSLWPRPFACAHEGYAVILEELDELWDHVKTNQKKRDLEAMRKEAVQVAAMAIRFIVEVIDEGRGRE